MFIYFLFRHNNTVYFFIKKLRYSFGSLRDPLFDSWNRMNLVYQSLEVWILCKSVFSRERIERGSEAGKVKVGPSQLKHKVKILGTFLKNSHPS
jgi:hypothetical protein